MSRSDSLGSPPATNACASTTDRVPGERRARSRRTRPRASASAASWERDRQGPGLGERQGVEVGQAVDRDGSVLVGQLDGRADRGGVGADEHAGRVDQPRAEPEPLGGVVVAAGQHHLGARAGEPHQRLVGQPDGVDLGERAVVDVTGDDHEVDPLGLDHLEQVVDVRRLVREHPLAVERPAQVPVGGVEDAHETTVGADADTTREPTPRNSGQDRAGGRAGAGASRVPPQSLGSRESSWMLKSVLLRLSRSATAAHRWCRSPRPDHLAGRRDRHHPFQDRRHCVVGSDGDGDAIYAHLQRRAGESSTCGADLIACNVLQTTHRQRQRGRRHHRPDRPQAGRLPGTCRR